MNFALLDIIFTVIILVAAIRAAVRGFITEFLSIAALLLGIVFAVFLARPVAGAFAAYLNTGPWSVVIAFIAVFLIVYLIVKIFEGLLHRLFETLRLEKLDRAIGFFLGIVEGLICAVVVVFILQVQPFFSADQLLGESYIARTIIRVLPRGLELIQNREVTGV